MIGWTLLVNTVKYGLVSHIGQQVVVVRRLCGSFVHHAYENVRYYFAESKALGIDGRFIREDSESAKVIHLLIFVIIVTTPVRYMPILTNRLRTIARWHRIIEMGLRKVGIK